MKHVTTHLIVASLAAAFAWSPGPAHAKPHVGTGVAVQMTPVQTAQFIFDTAVYLMGERKFTLACTLFEKSYGIEPAIGTQFYMADCYEQTGRFVLAWSTFRAVIGAAKQQARPDREALARRRALALIPRMGKIVMTLPPGIGGLSSLNLTVDGAPVAKAKQGGGAEVLQVVDPGEHLIAVSGGGKVSWRVRVQVESGKLIRIIVPDPGPVQTELKDESRQSAMSGSRGRSYLLLDSRNPYQ